MNLREDLARLKDYFLNEKERLENEVEYAKGEIDIQIESIKNELDQLGDKLKSRLDNTKYKVLKEMFNATDADRYEEIIKSKSSEDKSPNEMYNQIKEERKHVFFNPYDFTTADFNNLIGCVEVSYEKNDKEIVAINERIRNCKQEPLFTNYDNFKLLSLPNDTIVCAIFNSVNPKTHLLVQYNLSFHQIRLINKFSNRCFNVTDMITNGKDRIFITNCQENSIYICDLDFNLVNYIKRPNGSLPNELDGPYGIAYSNSFLYICDSYNQRIQKLNSVTLESIDSFPLDYQAFDLKTYGVNNQMLCVKSDKNVKLTTQPTVYFSYYFYKTESSDYQLVYKLDIDADLLLTPVGLNIYLFENSLKSVFCFNSNAEMTELVSLDSNNKGYYCASGIYFNNRFIFCDEIKRILIKI